METDVSTKDLVSDYRNHYNQSRENLLKGAPAFIKNIRDEGIAEFGKLGMPAKKSERYKYTFLDPFFAKEYNRKITADKFSFELDDIFKCDVPDIGTDVIIVVNGFYYFKNQINGNLPGNIWIGSLSKAIEEKPEWVEKYLAKTATYDDGLIALNTALFTDGYVVHVPKNAILEKPLQIINILLSEENLMVQQRNLIVMDENSSANIVVCDHSLSAKDFLTNSITEVFLADGARLDLNSLQNEHNGSVKVSGVFINQEQNSYLSNNTYTLHGGIVRNNLKIILNGEGAEANASGLFLTDKTQHVDNYVFINHAKPHCTSNQIFKGVLDDISTGSFNGRILVSRDAQKTMAYQKSSNLLLTKDAKMSARPQLEIYADDVKCSHGSTVGQLDQEALFYLRSRGIGKPEARLLLMFAFTHEIVELIKIKPLKERIDEMVNKRLRGELVRCHNCTIHCC